VVRAVVRGAGVLPARDRGSLDAEGRSVYVVEHPDGAGNSAVTLFVDDLDARVTEIAARGLEPDDWDTYSNGVRKVTYRDPDGNEVGFGGEPLG
jgi:hypothetical protein